MNSSSLVARYIGQLIRFITACETSLRSSPQLRQNLASVSAFLVPQCGQYMVSTRAYVKSYVVLIVFVSFDKLNRRGCFTAEPPRHAENSQRRKRVQRVTARNDESGRAKRDHSGSL